MSKGFSGAAAAAFIAGAGTAFATGTLGSLSSLPGFAPAVTGVAAALLTAAVVSRPIAGRRQARRAAQAERDRFAQFALASGDIVWDWDLATNRIVCLSGGLTVPGAPGDSFEERLSWWHERVHPDDDVRVSAAAAAVRSGRSDGWSIEYRFLAAAGWRWYWDRGTVIRDADGGPGRVIGCMTDISARREAEDMIQHVERRHKALIAAVSSIVWRDELGAAVQPRNLDWEAYTGQTQSEEYGEGWLDAVHPADRAGVRSAWADAMARGEPYRTDMRLRRHDGDFRWMSARGAPVRNAAGEIVEYIGLYQDVGDYYAAREELKQKSEALAQRVKEARCLHAVAVVCSEDRLAVADVLRGVALVLPSALHRPAWGACVIDYRGETFRSPGAHDPDVAVEVAIGAEPRNEGRILLGHAAAADVTAILPDELQLLRTAASLVSQMLTRRHDRAVLETQRLELARRQAMFEQTEQLAQVGGFELDVATGAFTCSSEVRRLAAIESGVEVQGGSGGHCGAVPGFLMSIMDEAAAGKRICDREFLWTPPEGGPRWLHAVCDAEVVGSAAVRLFGIVKDVTVEKSAQEHVLHLANHDPLTGLPNRRFFTAALETALEKDDEVHALLMIDLDFFKEVNDTLGHDVGDELLRVVASRLRAAAGGDAVVARLGGDEFAVLARTADRAEARALAERVLASLRGPVDLAGQPAVIACSLGMAVAHHDGSTAAELLKNADIALYSGKSRGRGAFVTYAPHLRRNMESRIAVCTEVRTALERDELVPFYQPKIQLATGEVAGFEALLRWRDGAGTRGPASIRFAFDDHALSQAIHARVLDCVIADMTSWRAAGLPFGHVAVNTTSAQYSGPDLTDDLLRRLATAGLDPACLGVEVTETVLLGRESDAVGPALRKLHENGFSIALDDFGTGYASLTHLQQYPVDVIKIDRSFIRTLGVDAGSQAITAALLGLGRSLGMTVVAEGVETAEQADLLRASGCDQAQGFLFARAIPASSVPDFFTRLSVRPIGAQHAA